MGTEKGGKGIEGGEEERKREREGGEGVMRRNLMCFKNGYRFVVPVIHYYEL